jgi:hypothetical protein
MVRGQPYALIGTTLPLIIFKPARSGRCQFSGQREDVRSVLQPLAERQLAAVKVRILGLIDWSQAGRWWRSMRSIGPALGSADAAPVGSVWGELPSRLVRVRLRQPPYELSVD